MSRRPKATNPIGIHDQKTSAKITDPVTTVTKHTGALANETVTHLRERNTKLNASKGIQLGYKLESY